MIEFNWLGFKKLEAIPVVFPMTNWILPANSDKMFTDRKK